MNESNKLIVSLTSPYARKVRIAALENKINFEMIVDVPWNEDTGVIKLNPLGKVPVMITKDGASLYDSRVIAEYIDSIGDAQFLPIDFKERIKVKQIEALADGIMDASLCIFAERKKRPLDLQYQWWVDRQFGKIHRGLEELSLMLGENDYFYGHKISLADVAVASALGYVGLRFSDDFSWAKKYPNLERFYSLVMKRPSFQTTVPVI
ncbi:MAG: glutathione S-transferase [Bacteriovoracaceae bacterium]|nr:glutathione S-transferase [Bacteriovoracaceae bacterium]